jgi:hypothetical protein
MIEGAAKAAVGRRKSQREEWSTQTTLARLLEKYLDPQTTFWTSLENRPRSFLAGLLQKKRGVRSGLPDVMVILPQRSLFLEIKGPGGRASKAQKRIREKLVAVDCRWWMARSARAALVALHRSGVEFRGAWEPPADLRPWEGPFDGSEKRLPQHPAVAARQRAYCRRWRERKRARVLAARDDGAQPAAGDAA